MRSIHYKMHIVFIIGIVQAFFIEFILLNKKEKSLPDKILAIWIACIGIHLLLYYLYYIEYYYQYPHILGIPAPLPFVHGPLLLIYVSSLISKEHKFNKVFLLHFIPALSFYLFMIPDLLLPADEKIRFAFEVLPLNPPLYWEVFSFLVNLSGSIYVLWSLYLLRLNYLTIKENFSYTEKINLKWLRNVIVGMAIIWIAVLIANTMEETSGSNLIFAAVTLFIFLIGYYGTRQGFIFSDQFNPTGQKDAKVKYEKSTLSETKSQLLLDQLLRFMDEEKPYLESKITLPQLASRFEINPNYLSQVINEKLDANFYDFINKYRVTEFKERLKKKDAYNFTLFAHASDSGFSSKSSFNEVFKKVTGFTPSQYQANQRAVHSMQ